MDIKLLGQLSDRFVALDSRQRDFLFEYRRVIPARSSGHDCLLILLPITWLISGFESTYTAVRFSRATSVIGQEDIVDAGFSLLKPNSPQGDLAFVGFGTGQLNGLIAGQTFRFVDRRRPMTR